MAMISRDPFARTELHRETVQVGTDRTCDWCGCRPYPRLFAYRTETDGGTVSNHRGLFCSKTCHDAYHS